MKHPVLLISLCLALPAFAAKPNILLVTVDDMSCDSIGAFGCKLPDTTPHIDKLASQGLRFQYAHVQVGNCFPSRNVMLSGRYPHNSGVEGFYQVKPIDFPVMCDLMKAGGYYTAIRGKVSHSTPYNPYDWDNDLTNDPDGAKRHMKDVASFGACTSQGIAEARDAGKPFCLNINISDPHKPFWHPGDPHKVSKIFKAAEVPIPGFLFDDPVVREELALYYTSVRRADDAMGAILKAVSDAGVENETVVIFLSDHGMPLPFAKTQLYHHSTRTPLIVKWPGTIEPGSSDNTHMVSSVDLLPTLLDIAGIKHPKGFDGRSYQPLLKGGKQEGRDFVFKVYNENAGGNRHPIRAIQTKDHLYLFNPWSDGTDIFKTATQGTATYRQMKKLAPDNPAIAARLDLMDHRVVEELYDVKNDPDCLVNLIDNPEHAAALKNLHTRAEKVMVATNDHALEVFRKRDDPAALKAYVDKVKAESAARRADKRKGGKKGKARGAGRTDLIKMQTPKSANAGQALKVKISHTIPAKLGQQKIHVTIKDGNGKRIERQVLSASGEGALDLTFELPADIPGNKVSFAAFIGEEHTRNLQYLSSKPITLD